MERVCFESHVLNASSTDAAVRYFPREEVVRCRDCFFSEGGGELCNYFADGCDDSDVALVEPDGFCSFGVRRGA